MDEYRFNQLNERASTIQDNTGATGLVNEPRGDPKGKDSVIGSAM